MKKDELLTEIREMKTDIKSLIKNVGENTGVIREIGKYFKEHREADEKLQKKVGKMEKLGIGIIVFLALSNYEGILTLIARLAA